MFIKDIDNTLLEYIKKENAQDTDYFIAKFIEWPQYSKNPWIKLDKSIGKKGNIEKECEVLLRENDVYTPDFNEKTLNSLKVFED